jgi:hypothetical protein
MKTYNIKSRQRTFWCLIEAATLLECDTSSTKPFHKYAVDSVALQYNNLPSWNVCSKSSKWMNEWMNGWIIPAAASSSWFWLQYTQMNPNATFPLPPSTRVRCWFRHTPLWHIRHLLVPGVGYRGMRYIHEGVGNEIHTKTTPPPPLSLSLFSRTHLMLHPYPPGIQSTILSHGHIWKCVLPPISETMIGGRGRGGEGLREARPIQKASQCRIAIYIYVKVGGGVVAHTSRGGG